ncbi:MAG: response regulator transcription factor [Spirochaetales bacterium]
MARILVVDDDPKTVRTITLYLENEEHEVIAAGDGMRALTALRNHQPDLIVLDLMLPQVDGLHVAELVRMDSDVPILMLTAKTLEEDTLAGFAAGADDYVTKPFSPRELVARVHALLRRSATVRPIKERLDYGPLTIDKHSHEVLCNEQAVALTRTEFRLLEVFVEQPDRVFPRNELVDRVFGSDYPGIDRSIDTHLSNLRRKLGNCGEDSFIKTIHGVGYRLHGTRNA